MLFLTYYIYSKTCYLLSGQLAKGAQAIIIISAVAGTTTTTPGNPSWRGQVEVFSENTMDFIHVLVRPAAVAAASRVVVNPPLLDLGIAVVGSSKNGALTLSNPSVELVQWRASVEPSFFSLPQSSGLLNPGQAVTLPVCFRPGAVGPCRAALEFTSCPLKVLIDNYDQCFGAGAGLFSWSWNR